LPTEPAPAKQLNTIRKQVEAEHQIWWIKGPIMILIGFVGFIVGLIFLTI
jgi:hypothetical protein